MLLAALSAIVSVSSIALAAFHVRALAGGLVPELASFIVRLKRTPAGDRPSTLHALAPPGSWENGLADAVSSSPTPELQAVAANEALGDLSLLFGARSRWAPSAVRLALLGALLFGVLSIIRGELIGSIVCVGVCAIGAGVCLALSSRAARLEKDQRKLADDLVETLLPNAARDVSVGRRYRGNL